MRGAASPKSLTKYYATRFMIRELRCHPYSDAIELSDRAARIIDWSVIAAGHIIPKRRILDAPGSTQPA
jgi:hypothetical protein